MEIRLAQPRDAERINELLYQVAEIHAAGRADIFKEASKKYTDEELLLIMREERRPIFVAVEKGRVIGYAFCVYKFTQGDPLLQDKRTLYIDDICVDKEERGRRVGQRLYEYVVAFAKENGFDNITLNVWSFNEKARRFYRKMGMTEQKIVMERSLK